MLDMPVTDGVIRLLARYSEGLRLAAEHGPTSGVVLEYAYENTPHGSGAVGRWIDRAFLGLSTWDSIRQRIQTGKQLVAEAVSRCHTPGRTTMILDVASGTAPYLRELAREPAGKDLVIECHDRDPRQVVHGRQMCARENLPSITFCVGDATDQSSYLTSRDPDVVLAIGLFPHLRRDEAVRTVMRLAFEHLRPGGCFLCTTLADPHARMVPWEAGFGTPLALRSPETIAGWLRASGFVHVDQRFSQLDGFALMGWKPAE